MTISKHPCSPSSEPPTWSEEAAAALDAKEAAARQQAADLCYLLSPTWKKREVWLIALAGHRCMGDLPHPQHVSIRCAAQEDLVIHPLVSSNLAAAPDSAFEVLCPLCHWVAHLEALTCVGCHEPFLTSDRDDVIQTLKEDRDALYGPITTKAMGWVVESLPTWPLCSSCGRHRVSR